jgi:translation initiation factor 5B
MFKSPIISFMGHVDAGKTSLKNIILNSVGINTINNEDGGITQSISSYFINSKNIQTITKDSFIKFAKDKYTFNDSIPGINIIDTPGHEAFNLMRQNTSKLCDIAIIVIDIFAGVKPQTIESIKILRNNKIPFIIVTTKLDLVDGYKNIDSSINIYSLNNFFKEQEKTFISNLEGYINDIKYELMEQKINCEFYFKNKKPQSTYSIIPLSTKTGVGISDLLLLISYISQNWMEGKIMYKDDVEMTVMNCYNDKKQGWVLDVLLKNGTINIGDKFIVYGKEGAKDTTIRAIYNNNDSVRSVKASAVLKLIGSNNSNIYTGTQMYPIKNKAKQIKELNNTMNLFWNKFELKKTGVYLVAPTMETLDALYTTFKKNNTNVCGVIVSTITDRDLLKMTTIMRENRNMEDNIILYFGSDKDLLFLKNNNYKQLLKEETASIYQINPSLMLMTDTIIYHLINDYNDCKKDYVEQRQTELIEKGEAVFPCKLRILKEHIFMKGGNKNLMFGVKVMEGKLKIGTELIFIGDESKILGKVISLQRNNKDIEIGDTYDELCIRLDNPLNLTYGRQFTSNNEVVSNITRDSIDVLKKDYRDMMTKQDWYLVIELKKLLNII